MARMIYITDMSTIGSGYRNLSMPIVLGLMERGHEVKIVGLGYKNEEHWFDFSLLPADNFQEAAGTTQNIYNFWGFDLIIIGMDIPIQIRHFMKMFQNRPFKYIGIMPIESDPLIFTWAMGLMEMDKVLVISEFGTAEAVKMGVPAIHIPIGIDTESWRVPIPEEKTKLREKYGYSDDDFIIFTNADNQERKLLSRSMEIVADFCDANPDVSVRYIMLTRKDLPVGWSLYDYAQSLGIQQNFTIFERGLNFHELWSLYAISDVHLLTSESEGLGLPVLESMATGVISLGTNCGGIKELTGTNRGFLIDYDYTYVNPFGNNTRYIASRKHGLEQLNYIHKHYNDHRVQNVRAVAREYAESRTWDKGVAVIDEAILDVMKQKELEELTVDTGVSIL